MHRQQSARRRRALRLAGIACVASFVATSAAQPVTSIPNPRTRDGTWVTDVPGMLRGDTVAQLNSRITDLERTTGAEMAVAVVGSLDGLSVDEAAVKLFQLWGIGKKDRDNGLLLLWSTGDRRVRVEVGYGLEGVLPDGKVGAILDAYVMPRFKAGEFDAGVLAGVDALLRVVRNEEVPLPSERTESYEDASRGIGAMWIALLGSIPAGLGSIVGFRRWRRYRRRRCPACGTHMIRLGEVEDDQHLEAGQQAEERIGSVDYDVWQCPACSHHFTLRYPKWLSRYDKCPQCHNRAKSSDSVTLVSATTTSTGTARVTEQCAFCSFRNEYTKTLPQLTQSSSSSGSSSGSRSSSFGGGSSGGGGASRGY